MSESEGFLARWNRRKRAAKEKAEKGAECSAYSNVEPQGSTGSAIASPPPLAGEGQGGGPPAHGALRPATSPTLPRKRGREQTEPTAASDAARPSATPAIDLSALPSIESITATTDIRGFLAPGVPAELKRAALRRAWSIDPAIRDFVGIAENQWDFTAPDDALGFGPLKSTDDVRRLVDKVFGDDRSDAAAADAQAGVSAENTVQNATEPSTAASSDVGEPERDTAPRNIVRRNENSTAAQYSASEDENLDAAPPRGHGGALPR